MKSLRLLLPILGFSTLFAVACSDDDAGTPDAEAGAGGQPSGPEGGTAPGGSGTVGGGGAGGSEPGAGGACSLDGSGTLEIVVNGLPADVAGDVLIDGPGAVAVEDSETFEDVAAGEYTVIAARVFDADPIVRTVFDAVVSETDFCLADGTQRTLTVTYSPIPSSNKLWMATDVPDDEVIAFDSAALAESSTQDATVALNGPGAKAVTFDRDGNLWTLGGTLAETHVQRFPAAQLGASGDFVTDIGFNLEDVECIPAMRALAFDADGNLWLSACGDEVHRIPAAALTEPGETKTSDALFNDLTDNEGIAFDRDGNLWVAGGPTLVRFDEARLGAIDSDPPDLSLTVSANDGGPGGGTVLKANTLAFDKAGNLWGVDVGANTVFQLAVAELAATGDQALTANVSFVVTVTAIPNAPAFDDGDGLWLGLDTGNLGRLSPAQLGVSSGTGAPVTPERVISSSSVGTDFPIAFFPAPAGLPIYHSISE